jgi:NAD(P)-dependent dehydrogenase (short-subunit alcohol dehydrogenase family)
MGTYVVTGSASGIGRAVKERIESGGHEVITVDIRDADIVADLSDGEACGRVVAQVADRLTSGLDGLVPCAGVGPETPDIRLVPLINYFAVVQMVEGLRPALEAGGGAVVLICSNSAQMMAYSEEYIQALLSGDREEAIRVVLTVDGQTAYGGGKQALARWMRRENAGYARAGIRMNAVAPGYTETNMTAAGKASAEYGESIRAFAASIPIGRPGLPEDQANAVAFLLGEEASFISGAVLFVDGGHDAMFRPDRF